eukprot:CAMPEP_0194084118 /NCGR_PEP_ID=MMETSP0149-20130528/11788_1 /TAXON_ID=122233 /ORGANISM="Chaetoceros debilis, Strain MM31A-1" /LENGTH=197 /DNA_ID=CAMNT_0038766679 /DNA_START=60 /DNA_END=653 /DNA_ORIENTATION=+
MSRRSGTTKSLLLTINVIWSLFFVAAIVLENSAGVHAGVDAAPNIEEILKAYDVDEDDAPDCQVQDMEKIICPRDEKVCCGDISEIKAHCANLLGPDVVSKSKLSGSKSSDNTASDAYAGCINYVSYHIVEHDHFACCPSEVCEDWLDNVFSDFDGDLDAFDVHDDDDFDDDDDGFDDDGFDDDGFDDDEYADHSEF